MAWSERARRAGDLGLAVGLTAGLIGAGVWISDAPVRGLARTWTAVESGLRPLPGSRVVGSQEMQIGGEPTRVLECTSGTHTPSQILTKYEVVARRDVGRADVPFLAQDGPDGGFLVWVCTQNGERRAVHATRDPAGGARYQLFSADAPQRHQGSEQLPLGFEAPPGMQVAFSVCEADGTGMILLEARGNPADIAAQIERGLRSTGLQPDAAEQAVLRAEVPDNADQPIRVPLHADGYRGLLVVNRDPQSGGRARACVTIRRSES